MAAVRPPRSSMLPLLLLAIGSVAVRDATAFGLGFGHRGGVSRAANHRSSTGWRRSGRPAPSLGGSSRGDDEFEPRSLPRRLGGDEDAVADAATDPSRDDSREGRRPPRSLGPAASIIAGESTRRQFVAASALLLAARPGAPSVAGAAPPSAGAFDLRASPSLTDRLNYQQSPVNKRYGVSLTEPERIYPLSFITYLSRFLLVFDDECQKWWYTQALAIPPKSTKEEVEEIRLGQFGQFSASVEVGLFDFQDAEGVRRLIDSLARRYGPTSLTLNKEDVTAAGSGVGSSSSSPSSSSSSKKAEFLKSKEALRQIGLLFSLLTDYQPVDRITQLLAADDNARVDTIIMMDGGAGYPPPTDAYGGIPKVSFPDPPTLNTDFGGSIAKGKAIMKETGRVLKVELTRGGSGYQNPPTVTLSYPSGGADDDDGKKVAATAEAIMGKKKLKGTVDHIEIRDQGMGYASGEVVSVTLSRPEDPDGVAATAKAVLEYQVLGIEVQDGGVGYAAEKAINIEIDPPPGSEGDGARSAFAIAYPKGEMTSYESFIGSGSNDAVSASLSKLDKSQWVAGPTSSQLLALLPSGFGLQYDDKLERYILSRSTSSNNWDDILGGSLEGQTFKPINPIFGFRGRSPIEKEKNLDLSSIARFMASGAICSCIAHFSLTPLDVVKTKIQTKPEVYDQGVVGTFKKVLNEEGAMTLFDGWESTIIGFFVSGGVGFFCTEYFRRLFTSLAMATIMSQSNVAEASAANTLSSLEIPLIVASAAVSGFVCCFFLAPFDAIRIRTVSQPGYADNFFGVVSRMAEEEGPLSLWSTVPVWFLKEIPYNVFKFLVFDTSTEFMYEAYPAAREDIRLSLLVSLVGGTLGGIAATIVSNPADVVVTELKKSKTDMSPWEAIENLKTKGLSTFARGMSTRLIFYPILVSLQFFLYDTIRIALGVGGDDMKLFLNVLNVALNEKARV